MSGAEMPGTAPWHQRVKRCGKVMNHSENGSRSHLINSDNSTGPPPSGYYGLYGMTFACWLTNYGIGATAGLHQVTAGTARPERV